MSQPVNSNQLNTHTIETTTEPVSTFSSADIQKVTELFSIFIKIDERIKKGVSKDAK